MNENDIVDLIYRGIAEVDASSDVTYEDCLGWLRDIQQIKEIHDTKTIVYVAIWYNISPMDCRKFIEKKLQKKNFKVNDVYTVHDAFDREFVKMKSEDWYMQIHKDRAYRVLRYVLSM